MEDSDPTPGPSSQPDPPPPPAPPKSPKGKSRFGFRKKRDKSPATSMGSNAQSGDEDMQGEGGDEEDLSERLHRFGVEDEDDTDFYINFTERDPMGRAMLNLARDNLRLMEKVGVTESSVNLRQICRDFYNAQKGRENLEEQLYNKSVEKIEQNMLNRDLSAHKINQSFPPPTNFSPTPTLFSLAQRNETRKQFPTGSARFTGNKGDPMGIVEFLSMASHAQETCGLSEPEFLEYLKNSTTGKPHLLIMNWIANGESADSIFHLLGMHFDDRLSPPEARAALYAYKFAKTTRYTNGISHILDLAARVASQIPAGESRTTLYNMEAIQGILRALPPASASQAQNVYSTLSARLGRNCSVSEFTRNLNIYRHTIENDIKANGVGGNATSDSKNSRPPFYGKGKKGGKSGTNQVASYSMSGHANSQGSSQAGQNHNSQHKANGQNKGGYPNNKGSNSKKGGNRNFGAPLLPYCSLCGKVDHTAVGGCPYMVSDNGTPKKIFPTKDTCNACPAYVTPRLNHPAVYCPFRPMGPLHSQ